MKKIDLTGKKYGRLVVLYESEKKGKNTIWHCKCDCGKELDIIAYNLKDGHSKSCGCLAAEEKSKRHTKHGDTKTRLFRTWQHMLNRCYNTNVRGYKNYGGRGISVCEEWRNSFIPFRDWAHQNGYNEDLSIDRIDVNGNYEPNNCRWTTAKVQANNKRNNRLLTYKGQTETLSEWADIVKISAVAIKARIDKYHWSVDKALTTPLRRVIPDEEVKCACGCGTVIKRFSRYGRERKYVVGHNNYARKQAKRQRHVGE